MLRAEHRHLAEQGIQLVEWRLDYIRRAVNVRRLLENRPCAAIATVRRPADGGKWTRSENARLMLLRTAIADGVDYVDLEHDIAGQIPRYGDTKRIVSYHNFDQTPNDIDQIHRRLMRLDPDIIKIATMANSPVDNVRVLRLCRSREFPTVAFCMGEMGLPSRILCGKFGSPMTYATFNQDRQLAPGMLTYREMRDDYRYEHIGPGTGVLGVIADPVSHSLSPRIHNACLRHLHLDSIYLPFRVPAAHLEPFMEVCRELDIRGLSVTIPHKERVLRCLDALDDAVAGIRAANTVVYRDGLAHGYNTDCGAALASLRGMLPPTSPEAPFRGLRVLVMGSGGVARAIGFGLVRGGGEVTITARDYRKADRMATDLGCKMIDWPARHGFACHVLINCTSAGMHPNLDETPYEREWFNKNTIVFDAVYNPEQTLFIKNARAAGCRTITGVDMFVRQAAAQFELFTDHEAPVSLIREEVKRAINPARQHDEPAAVSVESEDRDWTDR